MILFYASMKINIQGKSPF